MQVDAGTVTDASTVTEPEQLGPCEPGTSVSLEGIVWHETDSGTGEMVETSAAGQGTDLTLHCIHLHCHCLQSPTILLWSNPPG